METSEDLLAWKRGATRILLDVVDGLNPRHQAGGPWWSVVMSLLREAGHDLKPIEGQASFCTNPGCEKLRQEREAHAATAKQLAELTQAVRESVYSWLGDDTPEDMFEGLRLNSIEREKAADVIAALKLRK